MEEKYPTKGMSPVTDITMYNFIYWLNMYHHELNDLQSLPIRQLLSLTQQFENARPDIEIRTPTAWRKGFEELFGEMDHSGHYVAARKLLHR